MLPKFTGVLAVASPHYPHRSDREYQYRSYVDGRDVIGYDAYTREEAESELAKELERLAVLEDEAELEDRLGEGVDSPDN